MRIDRNEVKRIAGLARIALDAEDTGATERYCQQLAAILDYVGRLDELSPDDTPQAFRMPGERPDLRPDRPAAGLTQEQALSNAPATEAGHFRVPQMPVEKLKTRLDDP